MLFEQKILKQGGWMKQAVLDKQYTEAHPKQREWREALSSPCFPWAEGMKKNCKGSPGFLERTTSRVEADTKRLLRHCPVRRCFTQREPGAQRMAEAKGRHDRPSLKVGLQQQKTSRGSYSGNTPQIPHVPFQQSPPTLWEP